MIFGITYFQIIIRAIGILGMTCSFVGFQCKKHSNIMIFRTGTEMLFAVQYLLLGGYTGAFLNTVSSVRNITFSECVKRNKSTNVFRIVFSLFFVIFSVITWAGIPTLIFCIGKLITTFVYGSRNMTLIRIMTVITSVMWIVYNLFYGAYEAIASDLITITSVVIAMIRLDLKKQSNYTEKKR